MAVEIFDTDGKSSLYPDVVHENDKPTHSQLLGPDGTPLAYKPHPVGFQLTRAAKNKRAGE